jgi:hypothetical protein
MGATKPFFFLYIYISVVGLDNRIPTNNYRLLLIRLTDPRLLESITGCSQ